jgi:hypothetical protein
MKSTRSSLAAFSTLACATFVLMALFGPAPARAQNTLEGVLGMLGLKPSDDDTKYPERAPLVVPPTTKLPKPKTASSASDPAWPKDPDVLKKQAEEAEASSTTPPPEPSKALTLEQIKGQKNIGPRSNNPAPAPDSSRALSVQEMAQADEIMKQVAAQNSGSANGGKGYLTDPPSAVKKKAVITPEIEAATKAAAGEDKPWYKFW